jgi:endonuclease/exonuclease/phosphatase family metal-dependent hydrolase
MRIASFNVENMFERAKALNLPTWEEGRPILERYTRINELLNKDTYTPSDKTEIKKLLKELDLDKDDSKHSEFARLRQNRGRLVKRPKSGPIEIVANGRADWVGWVELKTEPVDELATRHTAMVMRDLDADVLGVIEAESRIALKNFSSILLEQVGAKSYPHVMVIDGNDDRGIDVGILTKGPWEIAGIRSHVDDDPGDQIFGRDCPEYTLATKSGKRLIVLVNHFKSKGYGKPAESNATRKAQAARVAKIVRSLKSRGEQQIAVVGDLNDTPDSDPLSPLFTNTGLRDISTHPKFSDDGRPGTYANGTKGQKIDYVLLSPAVYAKVTGGAVFRKGVWGGKNGTLFPHYDTMTSAQHAASDHAAIYADIDL